MSTQAIGRGTLLALSKLAAYFIPAASLAVVSIAIALSYPRLEVTAVSANGGGVPMIAQAAAAAMGVEVPKPINPYSSTKKAGKMDDYRPTPAARAKAQAWIATRSAEGCKPFLIEYRSPADWVAAGPVPTWIYRADSADEAMAMYQAAVAHGLVGLSGARFVPRPDAALGDPNFAWFSSTNIVRQADGTYAAVDPLADAKPPANWLDLVRAYERPAPETAAMFVGEILCK